MDGLRQLNGYAAGIAKMSWLRFALFNLLGTVVWIAAWCTLACKASVHAGTLYTILRIGNVGWYVGAALVLSAILIFLFRRHRRRSGTQ